MARPKIIDLFAGVGGFSLGASRAGFDVALGVDLDRHAIASHAENFPKTRHARRDVGEITAENLKHLAGINGHRLEGLIGGPPCQGFSTMGKMRKNDARNKLFFHFFRLVSEIRPLFFIAENVPGILDSKYGVVRDEALGLVRRKYHFLPPLELSAADAGVPTTRTRVFFIGWAKDSGLDFELSDFTLPTTTNRINVLTAFEGLPRKIDDKRTTQDRLWRKVESSSASFITHTNRQRRSLEAIQDHKNASSGR